MTGSKDRIFAIMLQMLCYSYRCSFDKVLNFAKAFSKGESKIGNRKSKTPNGCKFAKIIFMTKRNKWILIYVGFFAVLLGVFYLLLFNDYDFSKSNLMVRNDNVTDFSFINQDGKKITEREVDGKVYVVEYFFTTCKGICPKMNANMRRVFDAFKDEPNFMIISHTCMPETDSVPLLKAYEANMINGKLVKNADGSYKIEYDTTSKPLNPKLLNPNWNFVTGDKAALYKMARQDYGIDNGKPDTTQLMQDQFIHTQFFALVDKQRRVRGMVYDGLNNDEVENLINDIKGLLKERVKTKHFMNGFSSDPN